MWRTALTLCLAIAGCDASEEEPMCPGDPMIESFELSATTVTAGGTLTATFHLMNFNFSMEGESHDSGEDNDADHDEVGADGCEIGHVHVYLDDLMTNPLVQQTFPEGEIIVPTDVEPGEHTLIARLHTADHMIYKPEVISEMTITVE